jgi:3-mercaptopyruvate sulfurtransferase SseA
VALWLKRKGISRVQVLTGGLQAWIDQGFPVEDRDNLPANGVRLDL